MKQIHTHRGHCQLCTMVQALDVSTGIIAKHGYTVAHGYFRGTCPGSDRLNLHVDRTHADHSIAQARIEAAELVQTIAALRSGILRPVLVWDGTYDKVVKPSPTLHNPNRTHTVDVEHMVGWSDASEHYQRKQVEREVRGNQQRHDACVSYANDLEKWADKITGKVDAYQVKDLEPRDWQVGDVVRIGGKAGFDATIQKIEDQPYTTYGFRRGRGTVQCKHALVTRPEVTEKRVSEKAGGYVTREARPAKDIWVAVRDIKRPVNTLAAELKKAGKL